MAKNKVGIVDYDAGNLRSVINAVRKAGGDPVVSAQNVKDFVNL